MILKASIELGRDTEGCYDCPRWVDYQYDTEASIHTVDIWDCCGQRRKESAKPGEIYDFLADYRDTPEVLELINWLV